MTAILKWLGLGGAALFLAYTLWLSSELESTQAEAEQYRQAAETNLGVLAERQLERNRLAASLLAREKALRESEQKNAALLAKLKKVKSHDKQTADWADSPLPAAVSGLLKAGADDPDRAADTAGSAHAGHGNPALSGRD